MQHFAARIGVEKAKAAIGGVMELKTLGDRLFWARRNHAKLTQIELRDLMKQKYKVEIGRNYISEIETADSEASKNPSFAVVRAMAGSLGVSLDWLAGFTESYLPAQGEEKTPDYISTEADEAAQIIDRMRPEQRQVVLSVTRILATQALERTLRQAEIRDILDSVEREMGKPARDDFERILRSKGIYHGGV